MKKYFIAACLLLSGCTPIVPFFGWRPNFGHTYNAPVTEVAGSDWEFWFWVAILGAGIIFTPIGGYLISRLGKYKETIECTYDAINKAGDDKIEKELEASHSNKTYKLAQSLRGKAK